MALLCTPVVIFIGIILAPQVCFSNRSTFGNVTIYAEEPINSEWKTIVEDALEIIEHSELYNEKCTYEIFLVKDSTYIRIENIISRPVMAKAARNKIFLNGEIDLQSQWLIGPALKMSLIRTLAHEMTHCTENQKYGTYKANMTKLWKREGYAEYISHTNDRKDNGYSLANVVRLLESKPDGNALWQELHDGIMLPRSYIRYRVLVEYLVDVEGLTYDEIIVLDRTASQVYSDLLAWLSSQNEYSS